MEDPQNMSYEQIVSELDGLSGNELNGDRATALATERIKQIDKMMDLLTFKERNEQQQNNQKRISEERNNGRELMKILNTEPSILLKQSESYHQRMKEDLDRGYFNNDIELAVRTFLKYVAEKDNNKEPRTLTLPVSKAKFSVRPGFIDKDENEVHFNNVSGVCTNEESLRAFLKRRLT